jgi:hypothetical protein
LRYEDAVDSLELYVQSFIVKIWLEEATEKSDWAAWRGHITHVPSGEQRYITKLEEIPALIASYLERWGVGPGGDAPIRRS